MTRPFDDLFREAHAARSPFPDVIVRRGDDGWRVADVSPFVAAWNDLEADACAGRAIADVLADAADPLVPVIDAVWASGMTVTDYCIEFVDARRRRRGALVHARRDEDSVLLRLHDVTDALHAQREPRDESTRFGGLVAAAPSMLDVFRRVERYGPVGMPVVITGETGTGKELVAQALHERSRRARGPLVALNCAAISTEILESELFGHQKGAFTGAVKDHRGLFEQADGGTLFLDEVGEMSMQTQAKLLRVLETGTVAPVGGERERPVDVRVIAATNVPLELAVSTRRFRADLYHRLGVLRVHLPPLRERTEDIPLLVEHFLGALNRDESKTVVRLTDDALELLVRYPWPGNVRELRNAIQRVFVEADGPVIGRDAFAEWLEERRGLLQTPYQLDAADAFSHVAPPTQAAPPPLGLPAPRDVETKPAELTRDAIEDAFHAADGNLTQVADRLGVHKATLYRRMKALGISREDLERPD